MNFLHWSRTLIRETVIIEYERFWNSWSVLLFTVTTYEFYVKKIMSLRQDMQHMLMIAIQRQYVPSALQLDHNSPVKIKASSGGYENDEELTQDPEDFVQEMKEKEETISATENNNAATPLNHTRNGMHTEYHDSEKNKENAAFEDDQKPRRHD